MLVQFLIVVYYALLVYFYLMFASVIMSWVPELRRTKLGQLITKITDPYMRLFRGLLVFGAFDFTPILGFIIYQIGLNYFGQMINIIAARGL